MDPIFNPYSPGAGNPPPELAGREHLLTQARIALARIISGRQEQSLMLIGLRGVGKTVLLNRIGEIAQESGYSVVNIEVTESQSFVEVLVPAVRKVLFALDAIAGVNARVKRGLRVLKSFIGALKVKVGEFEIGFDVDAEKGAGDSGNLEADLPELMVALGEAAQERSAAVALIVDELQYLSEAEMSALIVAMHKVSQRQLPVVLVGAGLPQLVGLAGRSKSYAERLFAYPAVGALSANDAKEALSGPAARQGVEYTPDALEQMVAATHGYPYFLQEWGYAAWNLARRSPIDVATVEEATVVATRKLDAGFFRVRFDRLTPREKDYLRALAQFGPGAQRSGDVADLLGIKVQSAAPMRASLIRKGMIYSPAHGDTAFTVPRFDEYMRRTMPDWRAQQQR